MEQKNKDQIAELNLDQDPLAFAKICWPDLILYDKQKEIIESVKNNDETIVPAANMMGKDFVAGFIVVWYFVTHSPCRIVTTSVKEDHLRVLWGEIGRFLQSSVVPLEESRGGPLVVKHLELRKKMRGVVDEFQYVKGFVSQKGESMAGHHAQYNLFVMDEASGIENIAYTQGDTWAKKKFIFGNPNPTTNFFFDAVKKGDVPSERGNRLFRKVIKIKAEDSPNVKYGEKLKQNGIEVDDEKHRIIPGIITYGEYRKRRLLWDDIRQCIGLDAEFYEGAEVLLFPPHWLDEASRYAKELDQDLRLYSRKVIGMDPAEGGDKSTWSVIDQYGLIEMLSMKTPDTSVIPGTTIALMNKYNVSADDVVFDRGGGGKEHADRMRRQGYEVRTVAFGESATTIDVSSERTKRFGYERLEDKETRYVYVNRRAEMYGELRKFLNPDGEYPGFGIPSEYSELRRQLAPIPLVFDGEGRLFLPPKSKRTVKTTTQTLKEMLGCSPDEADSLALAVYGLVHPADEHAVEVGGLW